MDDQRFEQELETLLNVHTPNPGFLESDLDAMDYNDLLGGYSPQTPVANALIKKNLVPDGINPFVPFHHYSPNIQPKEIHSFLHRGNILTMLVSLSEENVIGIDNKDEFVREQIGRYFLNIDDDERRDLWVELFNELTVNRFNMDELLGDNPHEEILSLMLNAIEEKADFENLNENILATTIQIQDIFSSRPELAKLNHDDLVLLQTTMARVVFNTNPEFLEVLNRNIKYLVSTIKIPISVIEEIIQDLKDK